MLNIARVVQQLTSERDEAQKKLKQLDEALEALRGAGLLDGRAVEATQKVGKVGRKGRKISASAREKMAAAQRRRWAKWRAGQNRG